MVLYRQSLSTQKATEFASSNSTFIEMENVMQDTNVAVRNTRKSRLVREMAEAVVQLVENGNRAPTKAKIAEQVVDNSMGEFASSVMRTVLQEEISNELERYFSEVCRAAGDAMNGAQFHYTSAAYYRSGKRVPQTYEEAKRFVVCFGNGRTGNASGVRFPTIEDEPDSMLLVATQKAVDVVVASIETHRNRINKMLQAPALPQSEVGALVNAMSPLKQLSAQPEVDSCTRAEMIRSASLAALDY